MPSHSDYRQNRRYPFFEISPELIRQIVFKARPAAALADFSLIEDGQVNTNYRLRLSDGAQAVLKIYSRGDQWCKNEVRALQAVHGRVSAPEAWDFDLSGKLIPRPYCVMSWIGDGALPLREALSAGTERDSAEIADAVGSALAEMHRCKAADSAYSGYEASVRALMDRGNLERYLSSRELACLAETTARLGPRFDETATLSVVHGDFRNANILVKKVAEGWRVAGILDWETCTEGSPIRDIATLHYEADLLPPAYVRDLTTCYSRAGGMLPSDWKNLANLATLERAIEVLAHPTYRGEITEFFLNKARTILNVFQENPLGVANHDQKD